MANMLTPLRTALVAACLLVAAAARVDAASVKLAWDANTETTVVGYFVLYGSASGVYTGRVDAGAQTQVDISGLVDGQTYYFAVMAYDTNGQYSDPSLEISGPAGPFTAPLMSIDTPTAGSSVRGAFPLGGWAIDMGATQSAGVDAVHVWAYPAGGGPALWLASVPYGGWRPDVGAAFGSRFSPSGFSAYLTLPVGTWDLVAFAHSSVTGTFNDAYAVRVISRPLSEPAIVIDTPTTGFVTSPLLVAGWAADLAATPAGGTSGIDAIHVWAYPDPGSNKPAMFLGVATLNGGRPDIAAAFGPQFQHAGFGLVVTGLAPGVYRVVAFAHSALTGTFGAAYAVDVTVR